MPAIVVSAVARFVCTAQNIFLSFPSSHNPLKLESGGNTFLNNCNQYIFSVFSLLVVVLSSCPLHVDEESPERMGFQGVFSCTNM